MFWKSFISIIMVLHVCQWMTMILALCFKHEPVIQYVIAHHNLWTMPLPVSMKETVRCFNRREIKRMNNSHYQQILINWSFDTSRGFPFSFPPCFLFDSTLSGHFITRTSPLMQLTPPDMSQAFVTHYTGRQDMQTGLRGSLIVQLNL